MSEEKTNITSSSESNENISKPDKIEVNTAENIVTISANTSLDGYRLKNFYMTNAFQGFVWMVFHFSVVFFFTFQLKNVALVGVFLGVANFIAVVLDIPVGILQKYYSTKKLFVIAAIAQLVATGIFFNFIYNVFDIAGALGTKVAPDAFKDSIDWFFGSAFNWILILVASLCYGLAKEINDISTFGYILSNANPSEYGKILARNNITYGLGSLVGLVLSGFILSFNPTFAVITLGALLLGFMTFTLRFFDNSSETIETKDIQTFTLAIKKTNAENIKEYLVSTIKKVDLPTVIGGIKYVFLKPKQKTESTFTWGEMAIETKKTAQIIWNIMSHMPIHLIIYWSMSLVLIFGFWDTFASTFLIDFLDKVRPGWSYILLACIAIPALGLQELAGKFADKLGVKTVAFAGLALSGISLIAMGILSEAGAVIVILCALVNSLGYAAGMSLGQNQFLDNYNKIYAQTMGLKEIDANASAGPMKILQNIANVVGLVFGGFILGLLGYKGFFILFGILILGVLAWSFVRKDEIEA